MVDQVNNNGQNAFLLSAKGDKLKQLVYFIDEDINILKSIDTIRREGGSSLTKYVGEIFQCYK